MEREREREKVIEGKGEGEERERQTLSLIFNTIYIDHLNVSCSGCGVALEAGEVVEPQPEVAQDGGQLGQYAAGLAVGRQGQGQAA